MLLYILYAAKILKSSDKTNFLTQNLTKNQVIIFIEIFSNRCNYAVLIFLIRL